MTLFCYRPDCFSHVDSVVVKRKTERFVSNKDTSSSLLLKGQVTELTSVKWAIGLCSTS